MSYQPFLGVQGNCSQPFAPGVALKPLQCVLTLPQPLYAPRNFPRPMIIANVYARADPFAIFTPGHFIHMTGGLLWLANITIEGNANSFLSRHASLLVNGTGVNPAHVHSSGAPLSFWHQ
jgi:hypothetical protein